MDDNDKDLDEEDEDLVRGGLALPTCSALPTTPLCARLAIRIRYPPVAPNRALPAPADTVATPARRLALPRLPRPRLVLPDSS